MRVYPLILAIGSIWALSSAHAEPSTVFLDTATIPPQVQQILYSHDGKSFITLDADAHVQFWDAKTGVETGVFKVPDVGLVNKLTLIGPDGNTAAMANPNGDIYVHCITSSSLPLRTLRRKSNSPIAQLCFSPDGKLLAAAHMDRSIDVWTLASATCNSISHLPAQLTSLTFSIDDSGLAASLADGSVRKWHLPDLTSYVISQPDKSAHYTCIAWSPGKTIIAAGFSPAKTPKSGEIQLWDADSLSPIARLRKLEAPPLHLDFNTNGQRLLVTIGIPGNSDSPPRTPGSFRARLLDWQKDTTAAELPAQTNEIPRMAFSPDGQSLSIIDGLHREILECDIASGAIRSRIGGTAIMASDIAWSNSGTSLRWKVIRAGLQNPSGENLGTTAAKGASPNGLTPPPPNAEVNWIAYSPNEVSGKTISDSDAKSSQWNMSHSEDRGKLTAWLSHGDIHVSPTSASVWASGWNAVVICDGLNVSIYDAKARKKIAILTGAQFPITAISILDRPVLPETPYLVAGTTASGEVFVWALPQLEDSQFSMSVIPPTLCIYSDLDGHWLAWTQHGLYAESIPPGSARLRSNTMQIQSDHMLPEAYHRPAALSRILESGNEISALAEALAVTTKQSKSEAPDKKDAKVSPVVPSAATDPILAVTTPVTATPPTTVDPGLTHPTRLLSRLLISDNTQPIVPGDYLAAMDIHSLADATAQWSTAFDIPPAILLQGSEITVDAIKAKLGEIGAKSSPSSLTIVCVSAHFRSDRSLGWFIELASGSGVNIQNALRPGLSHEISVDQFANLIGNIHGTLWLVFDTLDIPSSDKFIKAFKPLGNQREQAKANTVIFVSSSRSRSKKSPPENNRNIFAEAVIEAFKKIPPPQNSPGAETATAKAIDGYLKQRIPALIKENPYGVNQKSASEMFGSKSTKQ